MMTTRVATNIIFRVVFVLFLPMTWASLANEFNSHTKSPSSALLPHEEITKARVMIRILGEVMAVPAHTRRSIQTRVRALGSDSEGSRGIEDNSSPPRRAPAALEESLFWPFEDEGAEYNADDSPNRRDRRRKSSKIGEDSESSRWRPSVPGDGRNRDSSGFEGRPRAPESLRRSRASAPHELITDGMADVELNSRGRVSVAAAFPIRRDLRIAQYRVQEEDEPEPLRPFRQRPYYGGWPNWRYPSAWGKENWWQMYGQLGETWPTPPPAFKRRKSWPENVDKISTASSRRHLRDSTILSSATSLLAPPPSF